MLVDDIVVGISDQRTVVRVKKDLFRKGLVGSGVAQSKETEVSKAVRACEHGLVRVELDVEDGPVPLTVDVVDEGL